MEVARLGQAYVEQQPDRGSQQGIERVPARKPKVERGDKRVESDSPERLSLSHRAARQAVDRQHGQPTDDRQEDLEHRGSDYVVRQAH